MKWCIETSQGHILEVTDLFDAEGEPTTDLSVAEACVLLNLEGDFMSADVPFGAVHRIQ